MANKLGGLQSLQFILPIPYTHRKNKVNELRTGKKNTDSRLFKQPGT